MSDTQVQDILATAGTKRLFILAYRRGPVVVRWRQQGARRVEEARTLEVALRKAQRRARALSGQSARATA